MRALLLAAVLLLAGAAPARAAAPTLFPSDRLTVPDAAQLTGKRVNLPLPDCGARPSDCNDVRLLNELDGFDVDPRVAIGFGKPIDVARVTPETVYVQPTAGGERIGLARLVFSPARNTLYGQPAAQLREGTEYRLVVTPAVSGEGAETTFTTLSATAGLRQMREQLDSGKAYDDADIVPAARGLTFDGVFPAATTLRIQRFDDTGAKELAGSDVPNSARLGAGEYAFGSFRSPSWLTGDRVIPATPTKDGTPKIQGAETVAFTLILPSSTKPAGGYPVAIFGPGITRSKFDLFLAADENASRGIATFAIDPVGHGFGPRSEIAVSSTPPARFTAHGRGIDLDRDGEITNREGAQAPGQPHPLAPVGLRDGLRQTALDNMALVRAIGRGVDVDRDGSEDLRREGITYYAQSLGGIYGTMLMATDPELNTAVLNVPGGPILEIARLSPSFRDVVATELKNRVPGLLNGGREGFTESTPLFGEPPITKPAQGAVPIQEVGASTNWINRSGSPESFAPQLKAAGKNVIYQFAFGDQTVPNPTSATIMRAGGLQEQTTFYRNDRTPTRGLNPHGFLLDPRITGRNAGQRQVVDYLDSEGKTVTDPDGPSNAFEVPIADPKSLETLNFSQPPAEGEPPPEEPAPSGGGGSTNPPGGVGTNQPGGGGQPGGGNQPGGSNGTKKKARLRVSVTPRRFRAGRRVRLRVRVTRSGQPVRGATVRFSGRRARTDRRGRVTLRVLTRKRGLRRLSVTAPGGKERKRVQLRVKRRR